MNNLQPMEAALNAPGKEERLAALRELYARYQDGTFPMPKVTDYVNNHIHTMYSFSPYSPTSAAYAAWKNGLCTAGIMDHDSISGAEEFIEAGKILGIATTVGFECRCSMDNTPFAGRRLNNPDQVSVAYLAAHGIPHQSIAAVHAWLTPYRDKRNLRNRRMVDAINEIVRPCGLGIDFDRDVAPLSMTAEGGSITERHILYALALNIIQNAGTDGNVVLELLDRLKVDASGKTREILARPTNSDYYAYYLLGALKASMVEQFYIDATDECPTIAEFIAFTREVGAISAYAYLGDVGDSVTGDKKTQRFEDAFLDELVAWLAEAGFNAITYMPTRNTPQQLTRLINLCDKHGLFEISGEDINTPFQSFLCKALEDDQFKHLVTATWALIGHEIAASHQLTDGMFHENTIAQTPSLSDRIKKFADLARQL